MKIFITVLTIYFAFGFAPTLQADIFVWTDENGVRKFSNFYPPAKAELFMKTSHRAPEKTPLQQRSPWLF